MLRAVNAGRSQPRWSVLSSRRSSRRLPLRSFRRMIGFTRNPSVLRVRRIVNTLQTPGKHEGFEFFQHPDVTNASGFACSRASAVTDEGIEEGRAGLAFLNIRFPE